MFVWESSQCKYRVTYQWTNSVNKNYESLWFILLQVTKGFTFQENKNVRFISGNFLSERFSCKVKTIRRGLYILINKHLRYRCLEFTILKHTWPIFAKAIIAFLLEFRIKTFCLRSRNDYEAKFRQIVFSELVRISHGQHLPPKFFFNICFYSIYGISICLVWHVMRYFVLFMQISLRRNDFRSAWI